MQRNAAKLPLCKTPSRSALITGLLRAQHTLQTTWAWAVLCKLRKDLLPKYRFKKIYRQLLQVRAQYVHTCCPVASVSRQFLQFASFSKTAPYATLTGDCFFTHRTFNRNRIILSKSSCTCAIKTPCLCETFFLKKS